MPQMRTPRTATRKRKPLSDRKNRKESPATTKPAPPGDDTPFSKAEALAAAAAHVLTLRHQSDLLLSPPRPADDAPRPAEDGGGDDDDDAPFREVALAPGPLGLEFEPEALDATGAEVGCLVVRVHDLPGRPDRLAWRVRAGAAPRGSRFMRRGAAAGARSRSRRRRGGSFAVAAPPRGPARPRERTDNRSRRRRAAGAFSPLCRGSRPPLGLVA